MGSGYQAFHWHSQALRLRRNSVPIDLRWQLGDAAVVARTRTASVVRAVPSVFAVQAKFFIVFDATVFIFFCSSQCCYDRLTSSACGSSRYWLEQFLSVCCCVVCSVFSWSPYVLLATRHATPLGAVSM